MMETSNKVMIFGILIGLVILRDLYSTGKKASSGTEDIDDNEQKLNEDEGRGIKYDVESDIFKNGPGSRISTGKLNGPSLKFVFCSSSGYKTYFDEFSKFILEKYPEISVQGLSFPPPTSRRIAAQLIMVLKLIVIGSVVTSQYTILHFFAVPLAMTNWMNQNKIYAALVTFFLANLVESQLVSTGAFEIYFDDVPVWSRMQTGRIPNPAELVQIIDNQLKLGGSSVLNHFNNI